MIRRMLSQSCCTTPAAMCFWATAFLLLYGAGLVVASIWPDVRQYTDTYLLASLGVACFANFGRHRTLHCGITGPVLVVGAAVMALIESRAWNFSGMALWGVVLMIVASAMIAEFRLVGAPGDHEQCAPPPTP